MLTADAAEELGASLAPPFGGCKRGCRQGSGILGVPEYRHMMMLAEASSDVRWTAEHDDCRRTKIREAQRWQVSRLCDVRRVLRLPGRLSCAASRQSDTRGSGSRSGRAAGSYECDWSRGGGGGEQDGRLGVRARSVGGVCERLPEQTSPSQSAGETRPLICGAQATRLV